MISELERMWKETAVVCFNVLARYLPGGTEENYKNACQSGYPVSRSRFEPEIFGIRPRLGYYEELKKFFLV
jgi:hypothetical protein